MALKQLSKQIHTTVICATGAKMRGTAANGPVQEFTNDEIRIMSVDQDFGKPRMAVNSSGVNAAFTNGDERCECQDDKMFFGGNQWNFGLSSFANDGAAAGGGIAVSDAYFNTTIGAYTKRLV